MISKIRWLIDKKMGPRAFHKSLSLYLKGKAFNGNQSFRAFMISGNSVIHFDKTSKIINYGSFSFGLPSQIDYVPSKQRSTLRLFENSTLVLNGNLKVAPGVAITVNKNAALEFGNDVVISSNSTLLCFEKIKIGDGTMISRM